MENIHGSSSKADIRVLGGLLDRYIYTESRHTRVSRMRETDSVINQLIDEAKEGKKNLATVW